MTEFIGKRKDDATRLGQSAVAQRMSGANTATAAGGSTPDSAPGVVGDMSPADFEEFLKSIMSGPGEVYVPPEGTA